MAIELEQQYPDKTTPASADYPFGQARNVTTPGDGTGTPLEQAWVNDLFGWQQALLTEAGITPSGVPDTARNSQHLEAMQALFADTQDLADILARLTALENKVHEDTAINQVIYVEQHFNTPAEVAAWKGYGTWERALKGRVAVGFSDIVSDPNDFKTYGATYGAATHSLTEAQNGPHKHAYNASHEGGSSPENDPDGWFATNNSSPIVKHDANQPDGSRAYSTGVGNNLFTSGTGSPHNNIQPSKTLDCWKRIA